MDRTELVVIGGGAAGLLAAGTAAERGLRVLLLEPNPMLGKKLRITGKGRCNVTNNCTPRTFLENIPRNGKFLYSAINRFSPSDAMAFFEEQGVPLKTERGNRVFPVSDRAADVVSALERYARRNGVEIRRAAATEICTENGTVCAVKTTQGTIACQAAILCTGGASYPATGSTGDGYRFAEALGHNIIPPRPSLVPLVSPDGVCRQMQGLSLRNVRLRAFLNGKEVYAEQGELLFTHFGLSGPLVLSASAHLGEMKNCEVSIDLKPALDEKTLDERLLRDFGKNKNRDFSNSLSELAPKLLIPVLIARSGIAPDTKVNAITREQRHALGALLKNFRLPISGPRPLDEAIVTTGGVDVAEINPRTMESKLVLGLYFAGEVMDVDAYTGGFNLQIAWASARCAALAVLQE